jgi:Uma2 family endonuclease
MAVMDAETKRAKVPAPRQPYAEDDAVMAELEKLHDELDLGAGHKIEILEGFLKVSPGPTVWHSLAIKRLLLALEDACVEHGWETLMGVCFELPPSRERIGPDLIVHRDGTEVDLRCVLPPSEALLVAEVVSPSSIRDDCEVKPRSCALAGIPFYLLVDRLATPPAITLFSEPGADGYAKADSVPFGDKLYLPEPFDLTLDTGTLPLPR